MPAIDLGNARLLLKMAQKDLKALGAMLDPVIFDDEIFGFHCQQVAEKALKAWISLAGQEYQRIHDLAELLSTLEESVPVPERFINLLDFNAFAVQHRYLPFEGGLDSAERERMLALVRDLLQHVQGLLARAEAAGSST